MLKKLFFFITISISVLNASYYTILDSTLKSKKVITFEDKSILKIDVDSIKLNAFKDSEWLGSLDKPKKFEKIRNYYAYNFAYLLQNSIKDKVFILKIPTGFLEVETDIYNSDIDSILHAKEIKTIVYKYEVKEAFDNNNKKIDIKDNDILTKYMDRNSNLIAIEVMDNGVKQVKKIFSKVITEYEIEKINRPIKANKFDFLNETLYLTYISKQDSSVKRMNMLYEMKKKNVKVVLKLPISLFDPEYKGSSLSEHVGIFRDTKKALYEMKKVQIVDGAIEISWLNHPKKKVVQVQYVSNGEQDKKMLSKVKAQQFYAIEGAIYLVSWMHQNSRDNSVFTFMNGSLPFDVTMIKVSNNSYEMQKKGQTIYSFKVDDNSFVTNIGYPAHSINIELQDAQNETTKMNQKFLDNFLIENRIKLIEE